MQVWIVAAVRAMSVLRGAQGTGMDLHCAMQRLPRRIAKRQSMGRTIWIVRKHQHTQP